MVHIEVAHQHYEISAADVQNCKSCKAPIWWVKTPADRLMPVCFDRGRKEWVSHFANCPNADKHRKKK